MIQKYPIVSRNPLVLCAVLTILMLGSMHDMMPLISLRLGLERVDGAKAEIFGPSAT